jgi:glycosyltransferase involved in cell wall biosynthesis
VERVAVFQSDHPFQVHTKNVVAGLRASGYDVDLFLFCCPQTVEAPDEAGHVFDLSAMHPYWSYREKVSEKVIEALRHFLISPLKLRNGVLIPSDVFKESLKFAKTGKYKCIIGVEKSGFVWASLVGAILEIPVIYYSLELYPTSDCFKLLRKGASSILKIPRFLRLRHLEKAYHKRARATIVQDQWRATELMKMNGVKQTENLLVPVSLKGPPLTKRTSYLQTCFDIPKNKKIILQLGLIEANRSVDEVVRASQRFPDNWVLIVHGPMFDEEFAAKVRSLDKSGRVIFSSRIVPTQELDNLVCSADVGFCLYPKAHINDYLTGFSSEKLARYLRCGIPVVTFDYPTYLDSVQKNRCGVCVRELSSVADAVGTILGDYDTYRANAFRAFGNHFEFNKQFEKVASYISAI